MILVYSKGDKFCNSTLHLKEYKPSVVHNEGTEDEYVEVSALDAALDMGYVLVSEEDYEALRNHTKCWENGALVDREKTAEELARERKGELRRQIAKLKENLTRTTTEAIMYLEGILTEEQYAPIKAQRQAWQDEINALEEEMKKL